MLRSHGRYDYSPIVKRPDYSWPGGKRLAVHFCLNIEHFAFGEGLGNDYSVPQPQAPGGFSSSRRTMTFRTPCC
jgi:hypothetical protein